MKLDYANIGLILGAPLTIGEAATNHTVLEMVAQMCVGDHDETLSLPYSPVTYKRVDGDKEDFPVGIALTSPAERDVERKRTLRIHWDSLVILMEVTSSDTSSEDLSNGLGRFKSVRERKESASLPITRQQVEVSQYVAGLTSSFLRPYSNWIYREGIWVPPTPEPTV